MWQKPLDIFSLSSLILAWAGTLILFWRLFPRRNSEKISLSKNISFPKVSIVIPARDEEHNLPRLLQSLENLDYPHYEIVVVDDNSQDQTKKKAESYGVQVLSAAPPPKGWNGKNWACHQAIPYLKGEIYLFTDADTEHQVNSLKEAVSFFQSAKADMMSALPFHRVERWWEKLLGPFHTILLAATAPYSPKPKRLFAIGQYLMFSKESYAQQGGHEAVKNQYPDDLALANACLEKKGSFRIFMGKPLFNVRMYANFKEFILGWRRNFLAGIQQSNWGAPVEVTLIFFGVTGAGKFYLDWKFLIPSILCITLISLRQKRWGQFSFWGILFIPVSLILFCWVTVLSFFDYVTGNVLRWKGRQYTGWVQKT